MSEYSSNSGTSWTTFADGTSATASATVTGLTNGTAYIFRVSAVNAAGTGTASSNSSSVMPLTVATAPHSVSGTANSGRKITWSWSAPSNNGGSAITSYFYQYCDNGSTNSGTCTTSGGGTWTTATATATATTSVQLTLPTKGNFYLFRVLATNGVGDSPYGYASAAIAAP